MVWDHNRDLIIERALTIFGDTAAAKYAWAWAFIGMKTGRVGRRCTATSRS